MSAVQKPSGQSTTESDESDESVEARTFDIGDDEELYSFIGAATVIPVQIHIVGPEKDRHILVHPATALAKRNTDSVYWFAGANCGAWKVKFDKGHPSPLSPTGPYSSSGPSGGRAVGKPGAYAYSVEAVDLKTRKTLTLHPDVVVTPMY